SLIFNSITISASGYSMNLNPIVLGVSSFSGATGYITVNTGALNNSIALNMQLGNAAGTDQFFTVNSGASLNITGQVSGTTGSELTKEGAGTLTLSGNNNGFTGPIKLDNNGGIVQITNANALGTAALGTTVGTNAQLQ